MLRKRVRKPYATFGDESLSMPERIAALKAWPRPTGPEFDRAGDWLLKNLRAIRYGMPTDDTCLNSAPGAPVVPKRATPIQHRTKSKFVKRSSSGKLRLSAGRSKSDEKVSTKKTNMSRTKSWRMKPNPAMDRAGDWILKNLSAMRAGKA